MLVRIITILLVIVIPVVGDCYDYASHGSQSACEADSTCDWVYDEYGYQYCDFDCPTLSSSQCAVQTYYNCYWSSGSCIADTCLDDVERASDCNPGCPYKEAVVDECGSLCNFFICYSSGNSAAADEWCKEEGISCSDPMSTDCHDYASHGSQSACEADPTCDWMYDYQYDFGYCDFDCPTLSSSQCAVQTYYSCYWSSGSCIVDTCLHEVDRARDCNPGCSYKEATYTDDDDCKSGCKFFICYSSGNSAAVDLWCKEEEYSCSSAMSTKVSKMALLILAVFCIVFVL